MKRFWAGLLIPVSVGLNLLAHRFPYATERYFSMGVYRLLAATYGRLFGMLPFSVSQFLIVLLPIFLVGYLGFEVYLICVKKGLWRRLLANFLCMVGVLAFMFTIFAGLNYARPQLGENMGLGVRPSYVWELVALAERLGEDVNYLSGLVGRDGDGVMMIDGGNIALAREAQAVFREAGEQWPLLEGYVPLVKLILYSRFMSRLLITGVYSPFTMEAHVNVHVPAYHIPATMLHEIAHFRGIMREDEANFVAWLVAKDSGRADFMYSGAMLAFGHTMQQLRRVSPEDYRRIMDGIAEDVRADFRANSEYWRQFTGVLATASTRVNDAYLRANRQEDGVASYGRMVDLLLGYFR